MNKKVGRNDPCHCGSGKKYKICHGRSAAGGGNRWMLIGGVLVVVALGFVANKILTSDSQNNPPPGPAPPGKVWSSEHGHWHDAPVTSTPQSIPQSIPLNPQSPTVPVSEPPGPAPPGKVWSPEHGHWHNAPAESTPSAPATSSEKPPQ
ncbi:MAG: SEC-C metal-binding domain-containing protein [Candidatus Marinimicrobia bacterium]|nr:SEC-C metal-binding domain-containing protein [Candidatus Neomarinimicrobiota bacterium]